MRHWRDEVIASMLRGGRDRAMEKAFFDQATKAGA